MKTPCLFSRREMLAKCSTGFGLMALQGLMASPAFGSTTKKPHFKPRAKHVILCYMSGGASHVDTFDPKPKLKELHGKPMPVKVERTQFNNNGNIMASPFEFKQYGQSGLPVSSLFPTVAESADELAVIRSLTSKVNEHAQGNYAFHTGFPFMGHPTAGAWMTYGLGTENQNLPGFVVLQAGGAKVPHGGVGLFSNGYLPAENQGSIIVGDKQPAVRNIKPREADAAQRSRLDFVKGLDMDFIERIGGNNDVEAAVRNYETAYRMQIAVPAAIFIIFTLLMVHFGRLDRTLIIMLSLPFGLIGGVWALYLAGYNFSVAVGVGFIALAGIAVETAVVMLLYIDHQVREHPPIINMALRWGRWILRTHFLVGFRIHAFFGGGTFECFNTFSLLDFSGKYMKKYHLYIK